MSKIIRRRSGSRGSGESAGLISQHTSTAAYVQLGGFHGNSATAEKRIRDPQLNDVLCGRGGGINSHPGNKVFREWVRERKNLYNLATSKAEKAVVSKEIVTMVQELQPAGRFLQKEPTRKGFSGMTAFWVEIDVVKALAKTSQGLREGAPSIRAEHHTETDDKKLPVPSQRSRKRSESMDKTVQGNKNETDTAPPPKRIATMEKAGTQTASEPVTVKLKSFGPPAHRHGTRSHSRAVSEDAHFTEGGSSGPLEDLSKASPLMSSNSASSESHKPSTMQNADIDQQKLQQYRETIHRRPVVDQMAPTPPPAVSETPELRAVPHLSLEQHPSLTCPAENHFQVPETQHLKRSNSLALSEIDNNYLLDQDFVNPFEHETEYDFSPRGQTKRSLVRSFPSSSSCHSSGDFGGFEALFNEVAQRGGSAIQCSSDTPSSNINGESRGGALGSKSSIHNMSSRSLTSELSDLPDAIYHPPDRVEFDEEMKTIFDATHPDLTVPRGGETIPTHLLDLKYISYNSKQGSMSKLSRLRRSNHNMLPPGTSQIFGFFGQ